MKVDSSCFLCGGKQPTIHHILSNCPEALQQGRYTWRYDCALLALARGTKDHMVIYANLPGMTATDKPQGTIPDTILITSAHPDIVIVEQKDVTLLELSIPIIPLTICSRP